MAILNRFPRFYFTAIRLVFVPLAAEFLAIPGLKFLESCDSRFCAAKLVAIENAPKIRI